MYHSLSTAPTGERFFSYNCIIPPIIEKVLKIFFTIFNKPSIIPLYDEANIETGGDTQWQSRSCSDMK